MNDGQLARASTWVFEATYDEHSLSSAECRDAAREPAVGHALARLHALFEDEAVMPPVAGVALKPTADQVYAGLRSAPICPNPKFDLTDNV